MTLTSSPNESGKTILDPCCGSRMWWFDKCNPNTIFGDKRREIITVTDRSHGKVDGTRTIVIDPDMEMDFRNLPFPDESFKLVAFDPPHLARGGDKSWLVGKYGKLSDDWQEDLRAGFTECFRVLEPGGTLVFKWNETHIKLKQVLPLTSHTPLFGQKSGAKGMTHFIVFSKGL